MSIPDKRIIKAVEELKKFVNRDSSKNSKSILGDSDEEINQNLQLIAINNESFTGSTKQFKLKLVDVPNSVYKSQKENSETSLKPFKILLILKDGDKDKISEDELFDSLNEFDITIDEVITPNDLKVTYKAFEKRRSFIQDFSLIIVDDNIITALPKLIGGKAYNKLSTTPIPIKVYQKKEFNKTTLINSIKKIYLNKLPIKLPRGTTLNVHLGNITWIKEAEFVANIESIATWILKEYNIKTLLLKSNNSPVLPIYFDKNILPGSKKDDADEEKTEKADNTIEIDGFKVELSNFEKSLLEIANPNELSNVFAKNIKDAKKRQRSEDDKEDEIEEEKKDVVKTKKSKK